MSSAARDMPWSFRNAGIGPRSDSEFFERAAVKGGVMDRSEVFHIKRPNGSARTADRGPRTAVLVLSCVLFATVARAQQPAAADQDSADLAKQLSNPVASLPSAARSPSAHNLRQYGIPFTLTERHTVALTSDDFRREFADFVAFKR